jgi:hypothetical protein
MAVRAASIEHSMRSARIGMRAQEQCRPRAARAPVRRATRRLWLLGVVLAAASAGVCDKDTVKTVRIRNLDSHKGGKVTVKGRTGIIVEAEETAGVHVFTLRDDYGDLIHVRTTHEYPIMGATYFITGTPRSDSASGVLYLEETSRKRAYPSVTNVTKVTKVMSGGKVPRWLLPVVTGVVAIGVIAVALMIRRRTVSARLPDAWGYAEIVSGPDQGKSFALRGAETIVGRAQDPNTAIAVVLDQHVSRMHGRIVRQGGEVYYEDANSRGGSWVNEEKVEPGQQVPLPAGALVRLGPSTVVRVGQPDSAAVTRVEGDGESSKWGEAPTEFVYESAGEDQPQD